MNHRSISTARSFEALMSEPLTAYPAVARHGSLAPARRIDTSRCREHGVAEKGREDRQFPLDMFARTIPVGQGLDSETVTKIVNPRTISLPVLQQTRLTILYYPTDRLCRRGAPMQNLAHSACFDLDDDDEPSKPEIKHLAQIR